MKNLISIVIRVKNEENGLRCCLEAIKSQDMPKSSNIEIIIVDNESTDSSRNISKLYTDKILSIKDDEFTWGKALNWGISKSSGEIILILSADVLPLGRNFISEMLEPFKNKHTVAVYGRQIARNNATVDEMVRLKNYFQSKAVIAKGLPLNFTPQKGGGLPVSNACAAIKRDIWEKEHYDEKVTGAEDILWTYNILTMGHHVVYNPKAIVYHSHNEPKFKNSWRALELIQNNVELNNKKLCINDYIKHMYVLIKKRFKNVKYESLSTRTKIDGITSLPFELLAFCITAFIFHFAKNKRKYRAIFWNRKVNKKIL